MKSCKWLPIRPGLYVCVATLSYIQGTTTVKTSKLCVAEVGVGMGESGLSIPLTKRQ